MMNININYYWINLNEATERRNYMERQFKSRGIKNKRIEAITPKDLPSVLEDKPPFNCGYPDCIKNGCKDCPIEYSVVCSHLKAIKEAYDNGDEFFVICEDDIYFPFEIDIKRLMISIPAEIDIIQMMVISSGHTELFYNNFYKNKNLFIRYSPIIPSAGFYIMRRDGAKKILEKYINKETGKYDLRNCEYLKLADVLIYQSCNTIVSTFPFCYPNINFKSQIHPDHYENHKDACNMIKMKMEEDNLNHPLILGYYPCEDFEKLLTS
jgi:GR25 family glycosyltransferase involved in LPS biosynthesis